MVPRQLLATAGIALLVIFATTVAGAQSAEKPAQSESNARFVQIENLDGFTGFFNLGQGTVRILALTSPSGDGCAQMLAEIERIMRETPVNRLRAYVVFAPANDADDRRTALAAASKYVESRVAYFWDPNQSVARAFQPIAGSHDPSQGGCLLYDTGSIVRKTPDEPALWLDADGSGFDGKTLDSRVHELLDRFQEKQRAGGE